MKSGRPGRCRCRRQPVMCSARNRPASRCSVVRFPADRILAILRERCSRESQSAIAIRLIRSYFRVFLFQPVEQVELIVDLSPAHLAQQFDAVWFGRGSILQAFVAIGANRTNVFRRVKPSLRFVYDVPHRQPDLLSWVERVQISGSDSAHLARIAVALEHKSTSFLGNRARQHWQSHIGCEQVLARLEVASVFV